mmetsp:Transcript_18128/g.46015  ORF Transcript_18128/g.46015 Transcript_18128/m.46015 type:complete len:225 (-) Transcript_18128:236-910(-)
MIKRLPVDDLLLVRSPHRHLACRSRSTKNSRSRMFLAPKPSSWRRLLFLSREPKYSRPTSPSRKQFTLHPVLTLRRVGIRSQPHLGNRPQPALTSPPGRRVRFRVLVTSRPLRLNPRPLLFLMRALPLLTAQPSSYRLRSLLLPPLLVRKSPSLRVMALFPLVIKRLLPLLVLGLSPPVILRLQPPRVLTGPLSPSIGRALPVLFNRQRLRVMLIRDFPVPPRF